MKEFLKSVVGDGYGNVSHTRLLNVMAGVIILMGKVIIAVKTGSAIHWDTGTLTALGTVGGVSILKTLAEGLSEFLTNVKKPENQPTP